MRFPGKIPTSVEFHPHPSVSCPWKRVVDIIGGLVGLVITCILAIPIGLAIYLEKPGPILFRQTRVGYGGYPFQIWKFRSMVVKAESLKDRVENQINADGKFFKNITDPRITKVGKFIRRTSLDEFPQFWNVLRGEMSLVGTRPPTLDEVVHYSPFEWQRLNVKPGLTGLWQTQGRSSIRSFSEVIDLDLQYQQRWSVFFDLYLILKTILLLFLKQEDAC